MSKTPKRYAVRTKSFASFVNSVASVPTTPAFEEVEVVEPEDAKTQMAARADLTLRQERVVFDYIDRAVSDARDEEREACALLVEDTEEVVRSPSSYTPFYDTKSTLANAAAAIRARAAAKGGG